jgi:hypothetical protein
MVASTTPSSLLHAREPDSTRRCDVGLLRQTYLPSAVVDARRVSDKRYKDQYVLWFGRAHPYESERALTLNYLEHRSDLEHKDRLLAALRPYIGRWVAIRGSEVLTTGEFPREVIQFLRTRNLRADSVFRVPRDAKQEIAVNVDPRLRTPALRKRFISKAAG